MIIYVLIFLTKAHILIYTTYFRQYIFLDTISISFEEMKFQIFLLHRVTFNIFNVIRQKSLILYRFVMKLPLIHLSKSKKLEVYQVIGLMDLSMRSPCIELLMRFKKIKLFQYCYMEHITIFMNQPRTLATLFVQMNRLRLSYNFSYINQPTDIC